MLPAIPDKLYFTIGEVSKLCEVKPHVLRYWEQEFPQVRPAKRSGGRRYYKRDDVLLIRHIRDLLYSKGFTVSGAKQQLHKVKKSDIEKIFEQSQILESIKEVDIKTQESELPTASFQQTFESNIELYKIKTTEIMSDLIKLLAFIKAS